MIDVIQMAVWVRDLSKHFGAFRAVDGIRFDVKRGEIFGFLGPNGAGKSTTIRMICGVLAPTGGSGSVAGFDILTQREQIKAHIGYMSQKFSLYEDLTVAENIDFYGGIYGLSGAKKRERKEWVLDMAGLGEHRHRKTADLATGWKQRLALGCAVLHQPPVLFLDEPTSGVDPLSRRRFWDLIYDLSGRGVTVFVTTHYMDEAEYCDRLALIYRGTVIAQGTPQGLKGHASLPNTVELIGPEPDRLREVVAANPGATGIRMRHGSVFAELEDLVATSRAIREVLRAKGLAVEYFRKAQPSLDDVFISLIKARDRETAPVEEVAR